MSFILAVAYLEITGVFVSLFIMKAVKYRCSFLELISLSFLFGSMAAVLQLFIYDILGIEFTLRNILIFLFIFSACSICFFVFNKPGQIRTLSWHRIDRSLRGTANLFITGITIQVLWVFFLVLPTPVYSHDAVANYALKAKIFFQSGGIPTGFFAWPESQVAHSDYPLFLPLLMTWIYEFTGFNDLTVNLIMPCIYVVFLGAFYAVLRRFFGIMYSLLSVFLLATIPQLFDYATIIHSDLLLTVFVSCACLYMMVYIRSEDKGSLIISSFLFGIALWIKNEAIVFAAAFLAVILISFLRKEGSFRGNRWGTIVSSFLPLILIAIPWFAVKFYTGTVNSDIDMTTITATGVWENIKDIPILLNLFQQEVFGPKKWNIFWVLFFSVLIWKRRSLWKKEIFYLTTFLTIAVAGYFTGYMITTGANIFFYVNTTISRFMLHFVGICMFYMMYLAWSDVKEAVGRMGDVR